MSEASRASDTPADFGRSPVSTAIDRILAGLALDDPAEVFQAHLMLSYLLTRTIESPRFPPRLLDSLLLWPGAPRGLPSWGDALRKHDLSPAALRQEAEQGEVVEFDGLSYTRGGPRAEQLHQELASVPGAPAAHSDVLSPFGSPYFFRNDVGERQKYQVHKLFATLEAVYPVVTVTVLVERVGCAPGEGSGFFVDPHGKKVVMDEHPGDVWALYASGSPYGRTPILGSGSVVALSMSYALKR